MRRFLLVAMVCGAVTGAQAADMPDLPFLRGSVTDGLTGDLRTFDGSGVNTINPMTFKNITSHDLKLGARWDLTSPQVYAPPPLVTKG